MTNEWQKLRKAYVSLYRKLELKNKLNFKKASSNDMENFLNEMCYDFNTANALTVIYEHVKTINKSMRDPNASDETLLNELLALHDMFTIFGLDSLVKPLAKEEIELVNNWNEARKNKDFETADVLRTKITNAGIEL